MTFRGYETFEHTADIGIRAWGKEFSELFEEAAKALFSVIVDLNTVSPWRHLKVELTADSGEELFFKWLKELLFIFETQHLVLCEFKTKLTVPGSQSAKKGGYLAPFHELLAEVGGEPLDNKKHALGREVKAITYHQFKLTQEKSRYLAEVILDI